MASKTYSTDIALGCYCTDCNGATVRVTSRKFRHLNTLTHAVQQAAIHALVSRK